MDKNLSLEQFEELTKNLITNSDGSTNKKCPLCHNDVVVELFGSSGEIKCKSENCFKIEYRGI